MTTTMTGSELVVQDLNKRYGKKAVLRGTAFSVPAGTCVGLLGANGSGKSTLLRILAGLLPPDSGECLWRGEDLLRKPALRQRVAAYVPQGTPLMEELSALDNLRLWYGREELEASLEAGVLRLLGVGEFLKTRASRLSGGMRKRLSIGCALHGDPKLLLLDEPTAALDLVCKEQILDTFADFRAKGGVLLMATHDLAELGGCDRLLLLRGGKTEPYRFDGSLRSLTAELRGGAETPS